jgi:hypothetical protein
MIYERVTVADFVASNEGKDSISIDNEGYVFTSNGICNDISNGTINDFGTGTTVRAENTLSHSDLVLEEWSIFSHLLGQVQTKTGACNSSAPRKQVLLDGRSLTSGIVTAVSE